MYFYNIGAIQPHGKEVAFSASAASSFGSGYFWRNLLHP
jgi:hypothetical protein